MRLDTCAPFLVALDHNVELSIPQAHLHVGLYGLVGETLGLRIIDDFR